jgi:hypothetical protein
LQLYHEVGTIEAFADPDKFFWNLHYIPGEQENYEYNRENMEELGFDYWEYDEKDFYKALEASNISVKEHKEEVDEFFKENSHSYYTVEELSDCYFEEMC